MPGTLTAAQIEQMDMEVVEVGAEERPALKAGDGAGGGDWWRADGGTAGRDCKVPLSGERARA